MRAGRASRGALYQVAETILGFAGLLFRPYASSKRNIARNASKSSGASCFPAVVAWAGDTSRVSTGDGGMLALGEAFNEDDEEGRRGGLAEYPST